MSLVPPISYKPPAQQAPAEDGLSTDELSLETDCEADSFSPFPNAGDVMRMIMQRQDPPSPTAGDVMRSIAPYVIEDSPKPLS